MKKRSVGNTLKNLVLALLNATLILVAVCLYMGLRLTDRVHSLTTDFASSLISIDPLKAEVQQMTGEVAGLRTDLAAIREDGAERGSQAMQDIEARLTTLGGRLDGVLTQAEEIVGHPEVLIDTAIDRAADELKQGIYDVRGCTPSEDPLT